MLETTKIARQILSFIYDNKEYFTVIENDDKTTFVAKHGVEAQIVLGFNENFRQGVHAHARMDKDDRLVTSSKRLEEAYYHELKEWFKDQTAKAL